MSPPLLRVQGLSKRFGETQALLDVSLEIVPGEVHVIAGENAAGKTTLVSILGGVYRPDAGRILLDGRPVEIRSPADAVAAGIGLVHQHPELVAPFTALENIVLGREGPSRLWLDVARQRADVEAQARRYGLDVPLEAPVGTLSVGQQQKVEILKTLYRGVRVLILDEPTSLLSPQEADALLGTVRLLTRGGLTAIVITHKIREARSVGDRVTVLRNGRVVGTVSLAETSDAALVEMMFGQIETAMPVRTPVTSAPALVIQDLSLVTEHGAVILDHCTLDVRAGEIVGLAGVAGNGQAELAEAIIGARRIAAGRITLFGRDLTHAAVADRLAAGLAYVPGDRRREGILPSLSLADTLILGLEPVWVREHRTYDPARIRDLATGVIAEYRIAARDGAVPTATLSGGNLQKLLLARAVLQATAADRSVLVAVNPTNGLDVATTLFVHGRLVDLQQRGRGLLLISEDLDELTSLCDRILVMRRGRIVGEITRGAYDLYAIGALMTGAGPAAVQTASGPR
jgi:simple sugar transport system ATP-binding protein